MAKITETILNFLKSGMLIAHTIFHYTDIITDYLLASTVFNLTMQFQEAKRFTWLMLFTTLMVMIFLERYKSFQYISDQLNTNTANIQISQKIQQQENYQISQSQVQDPNKNEMSKCKKYFLTIFLTLTYLDFLYLMIFKTSIKDKKNIIKKGIIEMYCENMVFNIIGLIVLQTQIIMGTNPTTSVLLSIACSFCSCAYVQYQSYLLRVEQSEQFEEKRFQPFSEFSIKTKLFISNPFQIGSLKPTSNYVYYFPELYKPQYLQTHMNLQANKVSSSKIKVSTSSQYYQNKPKLTYPQKFFLLLQLAANVLGMGILVTMQPISDRGTVVNNLLIYSLILYLPQIIIYTILLIKNTEISKAQTLCKIINVIIGLPLLAFYGLVLFFIPIKTEQLPFLPKANETWLHNFFPSIYLMVIKQYFMTFWILIIGDVIFEGKNVYKIGIPTQKNLDNIMDPDSPIRIIYYVALISFFISTFSHLLYIFDQIYQIYIKKNQKINQTEQIVVLQQKVKDLEEQVETLNQKPQTNLKKSVKYNIPALDILNNNINSNNNYNSTENQSEIQSAQKKDKQNYNPQSIINKADLKSSQISSQNNNKSNENQESEISIDLADTTFRGPDKNMQDLSSINNFTANKQFSNNFGDSNLILTNRQSEIGFSAPSTQRQQLMHNKSIQQIYENEYLKDSYLYQIKTQLVKFEENPKDNTLMNLYFQNTVFHPQGGGQPSDEGFIHILGKEEDQKIQVQSLEYNRDLQVVLHKITKEDFDKFGLQNGQEVELKINEEKRRLYARLHSGGHLLDMAVGKLKLNWKPGKGYHFEKSPYVEYFGELEQDQFETISAQITEICENYIKESNENDSVDTKTYKYEDAKKIMNVPDYIPEGMDFRYIKLSQNDEGCPCGGTHVKHIKDIERVIVTKIKANKNKKTITVYYSVNPVEIKQKPVQQQSKKQKKPKEKKEKSEKTQDQQNNSKKQQEEVQDKQ